MENVVFTITSDEIILAVKAILMGLAIIIVNYKLN